MQIWEVPSISTPTQSHRIMLGDSTNSSHVYLLTQGINSPLLHADPPYGMSMGFENDRLRLDSLTEFQLKWWMLYRKHIKENASVYIWGWEDSLLKFYYELLTDGEYKITKRNYIVWDKGSGQGINQSTLRRYAPVTEHCLFFMLGDQGTSPNADEYWEGWEPIRRYLEEERLRMGWDIPTMKRIVGHSDLSRDHWTSKSQWNFPTEKVYLALQQGANGQAFTKSYEDLRSEYENLRTYFNNTHDKMTDVWRFPRVEGAERYNHPTPKPVKIIERIIKTSSREGDVVLDPFLGSGSTLIAAENTGRICYGMEVEPKYIDSILTRCIDSGLQPHKILEV